MVNDPRLTGLIDEARLIAWLDAHVPELGDGPLVARVISGGQSNVAIGIDRGGPHAVLRRPPEQAPPDSEGGMAREARILKALNQTDVPHPHLYGYCGDQDVLGATFYVMAYVEGWSATITADGATFTPPFDEGPDQHYLAYELVRGLALLANVDHQAVGLGDFGRPDGFLDRQVDRWLNRFKSYPMRYPKYEARVIPEMDYVAQWLREHQPAGAGVGIMHGDYAPSNVMFAHRPPARLLSILDWELATIGDPMLDLGGLLINFRDEGRLDEVPQASYLDATRFPTRRRLAAYYAELTGRDVSALDYYIVLAMFRYACLVEYKVAEAAMGIGTPEKGQWFARTVLGLFAGAKEIAQRSASRRSVWKGAAIRSADIHLR